MGFRALVVERDGDRVAVSLRDVETAELSARAAEGDVVIEVAWSGVNYKDGLALAGSPGVMRASPLVPGIDLAGTVVDPGSRGDLVAGDAVVATGGGLGETRHGGFAARAWAPAGTVVRIPDPLGPRRAAAVGTAGFTAGLAVTDLERWGLPDGPVLVTGATGGVGSIGVALLAAAGREVVAVTGKADQHARLRELGAAEVIGRRELEEPGRPLQARRWAGALDGVGGAVLHNVLAQTMPGGAVAAYGLAGDARLDTTVQPFILRGVSLLGVNSVEQGLRRRAEVWERIARDLPAPVLDGLTAEVGLDGAAEAGARLLAGGGAGRTAVRVGD